jgi:hypothetical protein
MSSKAVSGWGIGAYESLIFDFSPAAGADTITIWFNRIQQHQPVSNDFLDLWVKPFGGSAFQISDVSAGLHYTDSNSAYVVFSELQGLTGTLSLERVIARAKTGFHFYVSGIGSVTYMDNDNDGYPADVDCDDGDPSVHPGATEICNDIDDNCDGSVDEGCTTYYRDADGDGFGDPSDSTTATSPPAGYVANSGDCDDTDASVYPGASESCNGVDDDCDGAVDEGCTLLYRDVDGEVRRQCGRL